MKTRTMRLALVTGINSEDLSVSYLKKQMDQLSYDVRLKEFNTRRMALSDVDLKQHLESLPDLSELAIKINLQDFKDTDKPQTSE